MTTPTPTQETPEALEALFNELADARASGKPLPEANIEKPAQETAPAPAAASPEPAPAAADVAAATTPAPAEPPPPAPQPLAIDVSKLDEETRRYVERLENDRKAAIGRAAAAQRREDSLKRQQESVAKNPPAPAAGPKAAEQLAKEFPELSAAVQENNADLKAEIKQEIAKTALQLKIEALDGMFPGWNKTMESPEFHYWLDQQDEDTKRKFEGDSLRDYTSLLRSYELDSAPPPAPSEPSEAERIRQQREQRLNSAPQITGSRTPPNPTGEPDAEADPEGYFNWLAAKREKAKAAGVR